MSGENQLIALLTRDWKGSKDLLTGVGDDCAVWRGRSARHFWLLKTDAVVENVHFTKTTPPPLIGRKALGRALSDIAAMGGKPLAALITLGVPKSVKTSRLQAIYRGIQALAKTWNVTLAGGETTRSPSFFLSIAMLGEMSGSKPVLRSTANTGDEIWVTGRLGNTLPSKHLRFIPRLKEGQWLAQHRIASAMMDLSDGLGADLPRLAKASRLSFSINEANLPLAKGATQREAFDDGEDYELLFTVPPQRRRFLLSHWPFPKTLLTCIGVMLPFSKKNRLFQHHGYDHFAHS